MKRYVWICGTFIRNYAQGAAWELNGVFRSKKKAVARCRTSKDFVGKIAMDAPFPEVTTQINFEYPVKA